MSNLTFSGLRTLQNRLDQEELAERKSSIQKYKNILEKFSNTHNFDLDLEQKLNTLENQERGTYVEKSSILNRQYAKYIEKAGNELQLSQVNLLEDNHITNLETQQFLKNFRSDQIKFKEFFSVLMKTYSITFESKDQRSLFQKSLSSRILTLDPELISLNALELCTREKGLSGFIEELVDEVSHEVNRKESFRFNSEIVEELEAVKAMLSKKNTQLQRKEKDLAEAIRDVQKQKSDLCNSVQQVYDVLSKMLEDNYSAKLQQLNKRFQGMEHQLRQKLKMIESKGQLVQKSNNLSCQELQKVKQRNAQLEKQVESQKLKIFDLEKKLMQEKDNTIAAQKKIEKLQQRLQEVDQIKETQQAQREQLQQAVSSKENLSQHQAAQQTQVQVSKQDPSKLALSEKDNKTIKQFQNFIETYIVAINTIPSVINFPKEKFQYNLIPSILADKGQDLLNNMMTIIINRQGFQQLYQIMLLLSLYQFKLNFASINLNQVEEQFKQANNRKAKYFLSINEARSRDFLQAIRSSMDKKKKCNQTRFILALLLMLHEHSTVPIQTIIEELEQGDNTSFIIESGALDAIVVRVLDDKNLIEVLMELVQQGPFQQQILMNLSSHIDLLVVMLLNQDMEFCEKLSILLQRIYYHHPQTVNQNVRGLLQRKQQQAGNYELLKQNLSYILNL